MLAASPYTHTRSAVRRKLFHGTQKEDIVNFTTDITSRDGFVLPAYVSLPERKPKGSIVVLQEIFGVNSHIRSVADRFAQAGYLAVAPAMSIAENLFLGRELRRPGVLGSVFRSLDKKKMLDEAISRMNDLKVGIRSMTQAVETLSGGQRQCVAVARAAAFAQHVVIMDEPTAALGVKEGNMVLELIRRVRERGLPVILISHNMPHVFEVADRIHIQRLGRRAAVVNPKAISMSDTVAVMTGAKAVEDLPASALA